MIVEAIIGGITAIVCSSLYVANAIDKRMYSDDEDDSVKKAPSIYPFSATETCPMCGMKKGYSRTNVVLGPSSPSICGYKSCREGRKPHMHVECWTCKSKYLVETHYASEENKLS